MENLKYEDVIQKIYIAYYQRPADPEGLIYWNERLEEANGNLDEIIQAFATSPEAQELYGDKPVEEVIREIYESAFNREPEEEGLQFYVQQVENGEYSITDVMLRVLDGAQGTDYYTLQSKINMAKQFTRMIDPDLDGENWQYDYRGEEVAQAVRDWLKEIHTGMLQNEKEEKLQEVAGKIILENWGGDKVLDVMQDLPLALSGTVEMWKEGVADVLIFREFNGYTWEGETLTVNDDNDYTITLDKDYNSMKDLKGTFNIKFSEDYKQADITIEEDYHYKTMDKDTEFVLKQGTVIDIDAPQYSWNGNWDTNYPYLYHSSLIVNNITGQIEIKHFDKNESIIDADIFNLSNIQGTLNNGFSYSMFDANLEGTIEIDGKSYTFRTENLTVNDWKDPDWITQWWQGTHLNEMQLYGKIYLTDEEGNELEFVYRNEDVNTTDDNYGMVIYNNIYLEQFDLIV